MIDLSRRKFFTGLGATLITAPAIVRAASLMPVKAMPVELYGISPSVYALDWLRLHDAMMADLFRIMQIPDHMLSEKGRALMSQHGQ